MLNVDMNELRDYLIEVASREDVVTYSKLAHDFGYTINGNHDANLWGTLLGDLSASENDEGRPLLSVIVVNKADNFPSGGFWDMAQYVGRYGGLTPNDRIKFASDEMKRVHKYWSENKL